MRARVKTIEAPNPLAQRTARQASAPDAPDRAALTAEAIANVSHEMRTPLQGTVGLADLLLDSPLQPEQRQQVETIRGCALDLLAIVNDILDYTRLGAKKLRLETIAFDLRQAVEAAVQLVGAQAREKGLELAVLVQQDVPDVVAGDPGRLRQVLHNLLGNAVKYTDAGEVLLRVRVAERAEAATTIRFEVIDTGPGIAPAHQARLFEPYYQVDSSPSRRHAGAGLGLTICRQLVELMGGQIGVESAPGRGSTFWVTVPLVERADALLPTPEACPSLEDVRVLVVDDNASARASLMNQIIRWRMRCTGVADGQAALRELRAAVQRERPYDLALIAMPLPEGDGLDVAATIKGDPSLAQTELVLLTAVAYPGHAARARELGIIGYLSRPVLPSELYDCIALVKRTALGARRAAGRDGVAMVTRHSLAEARGRARPRVLVVDNNVINQKVAAGLLSNLGCRVDLAANGREALAAMSRTRYALVLMDCHMPEMDGFAATAEIRRREGRGRRTPIIAMTASAMPADRELCLRAGMDEYLVKPLRAETAGGLLARWLPRTRAPAPPPPDAPRRGTGERHPAEPNAARGPAPRPPGNRQEADGAALMPHFVRSVPARLEALRLAAAQKDAQVLERVAHSLKGDCAYVGLRRLQALCAGLIALARLGATGEIDTYVDVIEQELDRACRPGAEHGAGGLLTLPEESRS